MIAQREQANQRVSQSAPIQHTSPARSFVKLSAGPPRHAACDMFGGVLYSPLSGRHGVSEELQSTRVTFEYECLSNETSLSHDISINNCNARKCIHTADEPG